MIQSDFCVVMCAVRIWKDDSWWEGSRSFETCHSVPVYEPMTGDTHPSTSKFITVHHLPTCSVMTFSKCYKNPRKRGNKSMPFHLSSYSSQPLLKLPHHIQYSMRMTLWQRVYRYVLMSVFAQIWLKGEQINRPGTQKEHSHTHTYKHTKTHYSVATPKPPSHVEKRISVYLCWHAVYIKSHSFNLGNPSKSMVCCNLVQGCTCSTCPVLLCAFLFLVLF